MMRRFTVALAAALVGGCTASASLRSERDIQSSDVLSAVLAAAILAHVEREVPLPQLDTARWYWRRYDVGGIPSTAVANQLRHAIEDLRPGTADSLEATRRRYLSVSEVRIFHDSALVMVEFGVDWREPCQWNGSGTGYDYRFRRMGPTWVYAGRAPVLFADPGPPPPPGSTCRA
jgi:hypothetical protein